MRELNIADMPGFTWNPVQEEAFRYIGKGKRIFFGGSRGGSKSHLALYSAKLVALQFPGINIAIVRNTYPEIGRYFIPRFLDGPLPMDLYKFDRKDKVATFFNKSRLYFVAMDDEKSVARFKGAEIQYLIIDEANELPEDLLVKIMGSARNPHIKGWRTTVLMTGNPGGVSDQWFKDRFVKPNPAKWTKGEMKYPDRYVFIKATVHDNPYLSRENDPDYIDFLESLPDALRKAWLDGDWDVFAGQFFEEWSEEVHVVQGFKIPKHWAKYRGIDQGHTKEHPTVCLWVTQAPANEKVMQNDGTIRDVRAGDVFFYREYVAHTSIDLMIEGIRASSPADESIAATYADPAMFNSSIKERFDSESSDYMYLRAGIPLTPADNNRVDGWRVMKTWMHWSASGGVFRAPRMYVFEECTHTRATIPTLRYVNSISKGKQGDCDTTGKDDAADVCRYLLKSAFGLPDLEPGEVLAPDDPRLPKRDDYEMEEYDFSYYTDEEEPQSLAAVYY